jgi:hypothetical protein
MLNRCIFVEIEYHANGKRLRGSDVWTHFDEVKVSSKNNDTKFDCSVEVFLFIKVREMKFMSQFYNYNNFIPRVIYI